MWGLTKLGQAMKWYQQWQEPLSLTALNGVIVIQYLRDQRRYQVTLPYHRNQVVAMAAFRATLCYSTGEEEDITQEPGVPYLATAQERGGQFIRLTNEDTGMSWEYSDAPMYGSEVQE
jgi:hypothetical protein